MNSPASADPFADSVARVVRAHARDGLSEPVYGFGVKNAHVGLPAIATFPGGLEILKGNYAEVPGMAAPGAFSILPAAGLSLAGSGFLVNILVWASAEAAIYFIVGSFPLWRYPR